MQGLWGDEPAKRKRQCSKALGDSAPVARPAKEPKRCFSAWDVYRGQQTFNRTFDNMPTSAELSAGYQALGEEERARLESLAEEAEMGEF